MDTLRAAAEAGSRAYQVEVPFQFLLSRLLLLVPFDYAALFSGPPGGETSIELLAEWRGQPAPRTGPAIARELPAWCVRSGGEAGWLSPHQFSAVHEGLGLLEGLGLRRLAALPLLWQGERVGLVCLGRSKDEAFSDGEIASAADYAVLMVIVMEHQRVYHQQQQMLKETRTLLDSAHSILGAEDLPTICQNLDSAFHRLVQADRTSLYLVDHENRQVIQWAADGYMDDGLCYEELDAGISGIVFRTGQPVLSTDADDGVEPEATRQRRKDRGVGAIIVVPLVAQGQVIGTVTAANQVDHRKFTRHDVELLMVLATNAAVAVDNVRMLEKMKAMSAQLRVLSFQDSLTGLFNRAYFEYELKRLEASGSYPISIILLDVDGLKPVNDRWGHAAGDELLKTMALVIQGVFRTGDVAARVGGDEFGILLENMGPAGVEKAVERLRSAMEAYNQAQEAAACADPQGAALKWSLRASIGAATASAPGRSLAELLKDADALMYGEKRFRQR